MAEPKKIYSVKKSYYESNNFIRDSHPTFYSSLKKAIRSVQIDSRIYNGTFHKADKPLFTYTSYVEGKYNVIVSIDIELLF